MTEGQPVRHASVDTLRGLTILLMVFGWHLSSSRHSPAIFEHLDPPDGEGMTIADGVFPAFLFIVGMSVPLAQAAAQARGQSVAELLRRTVLRTLSLLAAGVLLVNGPLEATGWLPRLWTTLVLFGVVFAWSRVPSEPKAARRRAQVLKGIGAATLVVCAATFRREDGAWLRPEWWGILGVIGWCYLAASLVVLASAGRRLALIAATLIAVSLYPLTREGLLPRDIATVGGWLDVGNVLGTHTSVALAGCVLGSLLAGPTAEPDPKRRVLFAAGWVLALAVLGVLLEPAYGVNKLRATPSWGLFSAAITGTVWLGLVWLMDMRGARVRWIEPVGQNPLAAYLFYQALLNLLLFTGRTEPFTFANLNLAAGVAAAVFFVAVVVAMTTLARRYGPWPRL